MTEELYRDIIDIIKAVAPPTQSTEAAMAIAEPIWEKLKKLPLAPTEDSAGILLASALTMLVYFQQGILQDIAMDLQYLRDKESGEGIKVKVSQQP